MATDSYFRMCIEMFEIGEGGGLAIDIAIAIKGFDEGENLSREPQLLDFHTSSSRVPNRLGKKVVKPS